jgi:hypothetical protein
MNSHAREDLDLLLVKLRRATVDYERARSRGDEELICRFELQLSAIAAERDRIVGHLSKAPANSTMLHSP